MLPITAVIITKNEEAHIEACIASINSILDEIIVIDGHSTDETVYRATRAGAKTEVFEWRGYGYARNYGQKIARNSWIFSIDADERCDRQLIEAIRSCDLTDARRIYSVKRINKIAGRKYFYSHLKPERKLRLYHRSNYRWDDKIVHERLTPKAKLISKLEGTLLHEVADNINEYAQKQYNYAKLQATKKERSSIFLIKKYLAPTYHWFRSFVLYRGFMLGSIGWKLAIIRYRSVRRKYC